MNPMPMPVMPKLPIGSMRLAARSSISKELATPCSIYNCCSDQQKEGANAPAHAHKNDSPEVQVVQVVQPASSFNYSHFAPLPLEPQKPSSLTDVLNWDDVDLLIQSSEPMVFDDWPADDSNRMPPPPPRVPVANPLPNTNPNPNPNTDPHVLHRTVLLFPNDANLVQTALRTSPPQAVYSRSQQPSSGYSFPLHIAMAQNANLPVLQLLVQAGPQVLLQKDGPMGWTPLLLALNDLPHRPDVHQLLRNAQPLAASIASTAAGELPLHVACRTANQASIPGLLHDYPQALQVPDHRGTTPLNLVAMQPEPHRSHLLRALQQQNTPQGQPLPPPQRLSLMTAPQGVVDRKGSVGRLACSFP